MKFNWTDGITCSVLRDGDAVAEVVKYQEKCWGFYAKLPNGSGAGTQCDIDAAKAAAERAIRRMRGEEEG